MRTKQKFEKEVIDYFNRFQKPLLIDYAKECALENNNSSDRIKLPYRFVPNDSDHLWFLGNIIDIAVFDFAQMKFTEIHYPWRNKKGDIIYKVINLEQYEKDND